MEGLSSHSVTGNAAHSLSTQVLDRMVKVLETESHEGSLIAALSALSAWVSRFTTDIPNKMVDFFPVST